MYEIILAISILSLNNYNNFLINNFLIYNLRLWLSAALHLFVANSSCVFVEILHNSLCTKKKNKQRKKEQEKRKRRGKRKEPLISKVARGGHWRSRFITRCNACMHARATCSHDGILRVAPLAGWRTPTDNDESYVRVRCKREHQIIQEANKPATRPMLTRKERLYLRAGQIIVHKRGRGPFTGVWPAYIAVIFAARKGNGRSLVVSWTGKGVPRTVLYGLYYKV